MQPGGGCGDGAFLAGEHRLIAVAVGRFVIAAHVVRQREVAVFIQVDRRIPTNQAVTIFANFRHGSSGAADADTPAKLHPLAGSHEAAPLERGRPVEAEQFGFSIV